MVISILFLVLALGMGITAFVLGILFLVSHLGGWGALARKYALTPETYTGDLLEEQRQRKAWIGAIRLGNLVTARCFERGIEMRTGFPFSPPLFFPWEEISGYGRADTMQFLQTQHFMIDGRTIRLTNPLGELSKRKAAQ